MTILLTDKKVATILEPRHMLELVDEYMGTDARMWFEDYLAGADSQTADVAAMETYYEKRIEHYHQVIRELRAHAEKMGKSYGEYRADGMGHGVADLFTARIIGKLCFQRSLFCRDIAAGRRSDRVHHSSSLSSSPTKNSATVPVPV